jgi:hypothetical protein
MIAGMFGLAGAGMCVMVADAFEKGSGARVAAFLAVALGCFAVAIFGVKPTPSYLSECDDYSIYASSC